MSIPHYIIQTKIEGTHRPKFHFLWAGFTRKVKYRRKIQPATKWVFLERRTPHKYKLYIGTETNEVIYILRRQQPELKERSVPQKKTPIENGFVSFISCYLYTFIGNKEISRTLFSKWHKLHIFILIGKFFWIDEVWSFMHYLWQKQVDKTLIFAISMEMLVKKWRLLIRLKIGNHFNVKVYADHFLLLLEI